MVTGAYSLRVFTVTKLSHTDQNNKREEWSVEIAPARKSGHWPSTDLGMFVGLTPTLFLVSYRKNVNGLGSVNSMILDTSVKLQEL